MSVTVSLVSHQSRAHLANCLAAVRAQGRVISEILLTDNASTDGTADWIRARHPDVSLLALDHNEGYAAAHNRNFLSSRGEAFLALNPDVVLGTRCVERMLRALECDRSTGAVGARLLSPGPSRQLDSAGIRWSRGRTRFVDRGRGAPAHRFGREEYVFGACGGAALYRRRALLEVARPGESPFAERFFMYYEDVDLAWRLRNAGWRTLYVPTAECTHIRGGSGASAAFVEYHLVRNRLWLTLRNASPAEFVLELPGLAMFEGVKCLQSLRRAHLRSALIDQMKGIPASFSERWTARA